MRILILGLMLLVFQGVVFSKVIHVPTDQATIQAGIDAAENGDAVLVAPGTYIENINFLGKAIIVKSSGGAENTVINGKNPSNPDKASVVTFCNHEDVTSKLDGFTLVQGKGTLPKPSWEDPYGGGIYCSKSSPIIINNVIRNNKADYGAGIACREFSFPIITKNIIVDNEGEPASMFSEGGGIYCEQHSFPTITYNLISNNFGGNVGGGISCWGASPWIINNVISNNWAWGDGGGICCYHTSIQVIGNTISGNYVYSWGGGGICCYDTSMEIINNTITNNWGEDEGGGIYCNHSSSLNVVNTILWNNDAVAGSEIFIDFFEGPSSLTISYSDVMGGPSSAQVTPGNILNWDDGMIDADPLFVDLEHDDLHLTFSSPCKNNGDDDAISGLFDFEGDPRFSYGTVDMGADEFHPHLYYTGEATPGQGIDLKLIGMPQQPAILYNGTAILSNPHQTKFGLWHLMPLCETFHLGMIPWRGYIKLHQRIPPGCSAPLDLPLQGWVRKLTNLEILKVR